MYRIIQKRKIFLSISGILCLAAILFLIIWPLRLGIDFQGGTMLELSWDKPTSPQEIEERLAHLDLGEIKVQETGNNSYILKLREIDEKTHQEVLKSLGNPQEQKYEIIGPTIGREVKSKAKTAVILAVILVFFYVAWAFRKLSRIFHQQESWRYGAGAIIALFHDMLIMCGFFALLGHFRGVEVNTLFVTALLTTLGYSINDTIVIFDRIRENTLIYGRANFEEVVNRSLNESLIRSFNTSLTTLLVLFAIALFAGAAIRTFALAMIIGVISGTWSSIAVATPFILLGKKSEQKT